MKRQTTSSQQQTMPRRSVESNRHSQEEQRPRPAADPRARPQSQHQHQPQPSTPVAPVTSNLHQDQPREWDSPYYTTASSAQQPHHAPPPPPRPQKVGYEEANGYYDAVPRADTNGHRPSKESARQRLAAVMRSQ